MVRISATFLRATATPPLFFYISATATCATFLVRASGAVALKAAQVPSTSNLQHEDCNLKVLQ